MTPCTWRCKKIKMWEKHLF